MLESESMGVFFIGFSQEDLKILSLDEVYKYFDRLLAAKKTMNQLVAAKDVTSVQQIINEFYN